jgi:hypothetical protein
MTRLTFVLSLLALMAVPLRAHAAADELQVSLMRIAPAELRYDLLYGPAAVAPVAWPGILDVLDAPGEVLLKVVVTHQGDPAEVFLVSRYNFYRQTLLYDNAGSLGRMAEGYERAGVRRYRLPSFKVQLAAGVNVLYVLTDVRFLLNPGFVIMTPLQLEQAVRQEYLVIGAFLAIFLIMTMYNLVLFVFVRKPHYLLYVLYLATTVLFNLCYLGIGYNFAGRWSFLITDFWIQWLLVNGASALLFSAVFLEMKQQAPVLHRLFLAFAVIMLAMIALSFVWPFQVTKVYNNLLVLVALISIPVGLYRYLCGFRPALYYTIAWGTLALGVIFFNLTITGVLPYTFAGEWAYYVGASAEVILLSFALGDLLRFKEQALMKKQAEYIVQLETEKKEKSHVYDQLQKMVYTHQIAMIRKGAVLEETMPTNKHDGVVIALDIVNSSRMPHAIAQELFRDFFFRCQELMLEGYDEDRLQCSAYRIKEMGDGFLCSVGFPFGNPTSMSDEQLALRLVLSFHEAFHEVARRLQVADKVFCSTAIAAGELEAFYPLAGVKEYDLYGRGIILAARYEALRKSFFAETGHKSSLIMVQQRVWQSLPAAEQQGFELYDITAHPVAEDPGARVARCKRV